MHHGPKLCYLKSDFTTSFDKLLLCVQYPFGEDYPVSTGSCFLQALELFILTTYFFDPSFADQQFQMIIINHNLIKH